MLSYLARRNRFTRGTPCWAIGLKTKFGAGGVGVEEKRRGEEMESGIGDSHVFLTSGRLGYI